MGKVVTFWSPVVGKAKVTASMTAVVSALSLLELVCEIAVAPVGKDTTELEDMLAQGKKWIGSQRLYERSGVSALLLHCKQGALNGEKIRRCALPLLMQGTVLFPGVRREVSAIYGREAMRLEHYILTERLRKEYGLVCLDLPDGDRETAMKYMEKADLNVIVLPQHPGIWKQFWRDNRLLPGSEKQYILLGGYLKNSAYGMLQYARGRFPLEKHSLGVVPLCEGYLDAIAKGRAMEFFLKNEYAGKRDENYEFMERVKEAAKDIAGRIFLS